MATKDLLRFWAEKEISEGNDPKAIFDYPEDVEKYLADGGVPREECTVIRRILESGQLRQLIESQPSNVDNYFFQDCLRKLSEEQEFRK